MVDIAARAHPQDARARLAAAWLALVLAAARPAPAQPLDGADLSGLVIEEADQMRDAAGEPQLDAVPGVREPQPLPAEVEQRLLELSAQRAAAAEAAAGAAAAPVLSVEGDAPARLDAGGADPDRLRGLPPAPEIR